ncbi:MAG: DUF2207 domain-containing protein [Acidobacteriia bacterium]|nr:DUF2207 domain-containing protein [Terriglobia bacterium]
MKLRIVIAALLGLLLAGPLVAQTEEDAQPEIAQIERILSFDSHIVVAEDRSMLVTETITVQSAGEQIKHGIYRDFPTAYKDRLGNRYSVTFDIVSLQRDGKTEAYHTSDLSNGVRVYFGRSDTMLPPGKYTYRFTYRTSRQLGFFPDHDELYWNVTGVGWDFPIDVATATVVLPSRVRNLVTGLDGYTGSAGEKEKAFTAARDENSNPVFRAEGLGPHQGLSIVVTWPKGLIQAPTSQEKMDWFMADNKGTILGIGGLTILLLYYVVVWMAVGRDPAAGTIVPLYEPPENLSPAAMRYLKRMGFDEKTFTAAVLGLAAKGYLIVKRDDSHTYRLERKKGWGEAEQKLASDEKALAGKLFENGEKLILEQSNHSILQAARKALQLALHAGMETTYFVTNQRFLWPGIGLTVIVVAVTLIVGRGPAAAVAIFMSVWLTGWTLGVSALLIQVVHAWRSVRTEGPLAAPAALFLTLFSVPFLAGECFGIGVLWWNAGAAAFAIVCIAIGLNVLFHHLLKAPTRLGRQLMDKVDGFMLFLTEVEGPRYAALASPAKTPELFEKYLPYALALGVEHAWAQQFVQVLAAAGVAPQGGGYTPSWCVGAGFAAASATDFTSSFSSSFSSAVSSASSSPGSSSGSGGGGSSGGGGGGGGGGGW